MFPCSENTMQRYDFGNFEYFLFNIKIEKLYRAAKYLIQNFPAFIHAELPERVTFDGRKKCLMNIKLC